MDKEKSSPQSTSVYTHERLYAIQFKSMAFFPACYCVQGIIFHATASFVA